MPGQDLSTDSPSAVGGADSADHPALESRSHNVTSVVTSLPPTITTIPPEAQQLVELAAEGLASCARESSPNERYSGAQLAALRAAAAMVAVRAHTSTQPSRLSHGRALNVWQLLSRVAPELSEWAALFHYSAEKRTAVAAGIAAVTTREADDALRDSAKFVACVSRRLGIPNRRLDLTKQWLAVT